MGAAVIVTVVIGRSSVGRLGCVVGELICRCRDGRRAVLCVPCSAAPL